MNIKYIKITLTLSKWSSSIRNELTPNEVRSLLIIILLLTIGAIVKILRADSI